MAFLQCVCSCLTSRRGDYPEAGGRPPRCCHTHKSSQAARPPPASVRPKTPRASPAPQPRAVSLPCRPLGPSKHRPRGFDEKVGGPTFQKSGLWELRDLQAQGEAAVLTTRSPSAFAASSDKGSPLSHSCPQLRCLGRRRCPQAPGTRKGDPRAA